MKVKCTGVNYFNNVIYQSPTVGQQEVASATVSFTPIVEDNSPTVASFTLTYQGIEDIVEFFPGKEYTLELNPVQE